MNVLVDQSGRIVLADFGLARSMADSSSLTAAGTLMGTPMYLSPEQSRGESLTPASDQFSLGVLACRMLTGKLPWGPNAAPALMMMRIVSHAPPAPSSLHPEVGPAVDAVFDRVLAKKPGGRFESSGAFAMALREALLPRQPSPPVDTPTEIRLDPRRSGDRPRDRRHRRRGGEEAARLHAGVVSRPASRRAGQGDRRRPVPPGGAPRLTGQATAVFRSP